MKGVRDAMPYLNQQAERNANGSWLIEYLEHSGVDGDGIVELR